MWNLNPEYFKRVKEELTGRQAAIQALLAHELENLEADLEEVETIERLAYAFAAKHLPDNEAAVTTELETVVVSEAAPETTPETIAALRGEKETDLEEPFPEPMDGKSVVSRWRIRAKSDPASS